MEARYYPKSTHIKRVIGVCNAKLDIHTVHMGTVNRDLISAIALELIASKCFSLLNHSSAVWGIVRSSTSP